MNGPAAQSSGFRFSLLVWAVRDASSNLGVFATVAATISVSIAIPSILLCCWALILRDPSPGHSDQLYHVQLDHWGTRFDWDRAHQFEDPTEPPDQLTYMDATTLLRVDSDTSKAAAVYEFASEAAPGEGGSATPVSVAATSADFFAMVSAPVRLGRTWSRADDAGKARIVVISEKLNDSLYHGANSLGKDIVIGNSAFVIVGILKAWRPPTKFFSSQIYAPMDDAYVPFASAVELEKAPLQGQCSGNVRFALPELTTSECVWVDYWVMLGTEVKRQQYSKHLLSYIAEQKALGRFPRAPNVRLRNAREWVQHLQAGSGAGMALMPATAGGLLLVLVTLGNAVALLLARFMQHAPEVAMQRAVGADRRAIFVHYLTQCGLIGLAAGLLGMILCVAVLAVLRSTMDADLRAYGFSLEAMSTMDWQMCLTAIGLGLLGTGAAGLYPAWKVSRLEPAAVLRGGGLR
jgi:putative ABC transport system permease protein